MMIRLQKKVAVVCFSHSLGGLELSTIHLAQAMENKGVSTVVIVPKSSALEQRAKDANLRVITITPRWKYGDVIAAHQLATVLKDQQIELVLLMQSKDIHLAALASMTSSQVKLVF